MFYSIAKAATDAAGTLGGSGAASGGGSETQLVTCSGLDCSVCNLIQTVVNIFYYLTWYIAFPLAVLFLIIGGFIYIGSRGNERWMSFAKRGIMYTIGGFMVAVLAFLAINTIIQVIGGTSNGIWSKMECGSDATSLNKYPQMRTSDLQKNVKSGGPLGGKLSQNTNANDILKLLNDIQPSDMVVFESELHGNRKALMSVGKTNGQPQLLYIDRTMINAILNDAKTGFVVNTANAQLTSSEIDSSIQELINEISQITAKIIASNHDLFVVVTGKPDGAAVSSILGIVSKVNQCFDSQGTWYAFPDICTAQKESCNPTQCTPSGNDLVASCKCPSDKCLNGGQCVKKK